MINVVLQLINPKNPLKSDIYTWFPYTDESCGENSAHRLIDSFTNGKFTRNVDLFPNKIPEDLKGCKVNVEFVFWPPFVMREGAIKRQNNTYDLVSGFEVQLMNSIAQIAGFNVSYTTSDIPENWGEIYPNGSASGIMLKLKNREVDVGLGSISSNWVRHLFLDHSMPYYKDSFIWCVQAAKQMESWENLINIFGLGTWLAILICYVAVSVILRNFHNTLAMLLGIAVKLRHGLRFVVITWLGFALIINTAYKTDLVSVLTNPTYEHQISTAEEILKSDLKILCMKSLEIFLDRNEKDWKVQELFRKWQNCPEIDYCLDKTAQEDDVAVTVPELRYKYVANNYLKKNGRSRLYCSKNEIVNFPIEMLMTKGYPLRERINDVLMKIIDAGLIAKWTSDIKNVINMDRSMIVEEETKEMKLKMSHLSGAFYGLLFGWLMSLLLFLIEMYVSQRKNN